MMEDLLPYFFLLRVPLFFLLVLCLLPVISLTMARPLLANLFDLDARGTGFAAIATLALAWSVLMTFYITLRHQERFGLDTFHLKGIGPGWGISLLFVILVVPTILGIRRRMGPEFTPSHWLWIGYGVGTGIALGGLADFFARNAIPTLQRLLPAVQLGTGYVENGVIGASHLFAFCAFAFSLLTYLWLGSLPKPDVPTLAYLNIFFSILCWTLSGVAYFFDAFRFPLTLAVVAVLMFSGYVVHRRSDHYFEVVPCTDVAPPAASEVLDARPDDPVIIVAANGGGIQSAAWTARVLEGLDRKWRAYSPDKDRFRRSVRLISAVSGGSVGAMHFLSLFDGTPAEEIVDNARASSLDDVAWGLVYPDFITLLLPWATNLLHDRGNALERAWVRTGAAGLERPLAASYDAVRAGERPAVVYNATLTESGERLLMGTTSIPTRDGDGRRNLSEVIRGGDVKNVTAARLSATFPFVTPVARPHDGNPEGFHVADGGYYDNYGTVTAVEWLDDGLQNARRRPSNILLLELYGAPAEDEAHGSSRGWFYQVFAPLTCMLAVRTAGQLAHKTLHVDFLKRYWGTHGVRIQSAVFCFPGREAPLSWRLGRDEMRAIDVEFEISRLQWEAVRDFLEGKPREDVKGAC